MQVQDVDYVLVDPDDFAVSMTKYLRTGTVVIDIANLERPRKNTTLTYNSIL